MRISKAKAPGSDSTPAEVYTFGGPNLIRSLSLSCTSQRVGTSDTLAEFQERLHHKRKGNRKVCDNQRGISLALHCQDNSCQGYAKPSESSLGARFTTRELVRVQVGPQYCRYDLRHALAAGEVSGAKYYPLHYICGQTRLRPSTLFAEKGYGRLCLVALINSSQWSKNSTVVCRQAFRMS